MRKKNVAHSLIVVIVLGALAAACPRREKSGAAQPAQTQTIAPVQGQPAPTGTDAMTQTVEVEDSRSEADGGVTSPQSASEKPATTKSAPSKATPKKPAKKH